ncbi:MAG: formylglycine-generating enzyme family protein [Litorimonas sp.]
MPAGTANIGSNNAYVEERPVRQVTIRAFNIDPTEVTNAQFAEFVMATDYVTSAEKIQPGFDMPGSAVFVPPDVTHPSWWRFVEGASWRHPEGPDSSIMGRDNFPVVHVSHEDAQAYATWKGRALPSEAQWEYAAKAGTNTRYMWGETRTIEGEEQANTWQGAFPIQNTNDDGYLRRSPVGCYSPNAFGLYDMVGNVWEWTNTIYRESESEPVYVIKGGSFLCAENYCRRYRPAARQPQEAGFPTNHIGFRTVSSTKIE